MRRKNSARQKTSVVEVWGKPFLIGKINFNYARWFDQSTKLVFWREEFFLRIFHARYAYKKQSLGSKESLSTN